MAGIVRNVDAAASDTGVAVKYMLVLSPTLGVSLMFCILAERLIVAAGARWSACPSSLRVIPGLAKASTQPIRF